MVAELLRVKAHVRWLLFSKSKVRGHLKIGGYHKDSSLVRSRV